LALQQLILELILLVIELQLRDLQVEGQIWLKGQQHFFAGLMKVDNGKPKPLLKQHLEGVWESRPVASTHLIL
jgi:hypothetical protein